MSRRFKYLSPILAIVFILPILGICNAIYAQQPSSRGGERGSRPVWDGIWSTGYGKMEIGQHGNMVVGRYGTENGRIWGTVRDDTLEFEWEINPDGESFDNGEGEFTLEYGGNSFTGSWWYAGGKSSDYEWNGSKTGERIIEGSVSNVDYCVWHGSWNINDGSILFKQEMNSPDVEGEIIFENQHAHFTGHASGWDFNIELDDSGDIPGYASLTMSHDLGTFSGELIREGIEEPVFIIGSFADAGHRSQIDGSWEMSWGETEILQDDLTGIVNGTVRDAEINDQTGAITFEGIVVGEFCLLDWTFTSGDVEISGQAGMSLRSGNSLNGVRWNSDDPEMRTKLSGSRKQD